MRDRYLITDEALADSLEIFTEVSAGQAKEAGNLQPDGGGSFTDPELTRCLYGDGKVVTPLSTAKPGTTRMDRKTKKRRRARSDPDAGWHTEGGNKKRVWGIKCAFLSTRRREEGRLPYYEVLECTRIQRHKDKDTFRWYGYYRLPERYGKRSSRCGSTRRRGTIAGA